MFERGQSYGGPMILYAASRPIDDDHVEPHRWSIEGESYDALFEEAQASVPEGWRLLSVRVERD